MWTGYPPQEDLANSGYRSVREKNQKLFETLAMYWRLARTPCSKYIMAMSTFFFPQKCGEFGRILFPENPLQKLQPIFCLSPSGEISTPKKKSPVLGKQVLWPWDFCQIWLHDREEYQNSLGIVLPIFQLHSSRTYYFKIWQFPPKKNPLHNNVAMKNFGTFFFFFP